MNRLFSDHVKRTVYSLDGVWDFKTDKEHVGEMQKWYEDFPKEEIMQMAVPSCINNRLGMIEYQDICWYQKKFYAKKGILLIRFGAVSEYAKVWLDGSYLGDHYGGFTAFEFIADVEEGEHTLVVMVDARSTEDTLPLWAVDWHHYCGIMRSVEVSSLADVSISGLAVRYELSQDLKDVKMCITAGLRRHGGRCADGMTGQGMTKESVLGEKPECDMRQCTLKVWLDDTLIHEQAYEVDGNREITVEYELKDVRLWDVGKPELYTVRLETDEDDLIDRVGFRKIAVEGKKLILNGRPLTIKGVNRHEEHPDWGFAVPLSIMQRDMDILKDLNVNTVRGSHYPNSKYFLDMCDAEGILFWSEIPMWGFPEKNLQRPLVIERGLKMHEEMVEQYFNHPSIIIWGMHNEVDSDTEAGYRITKTFMQKVRSMDNSRLITYATNRILKDECLDLIDFISVNQYVGWYEGDICDWADFMVQMKAYLKEKGVDNKPVLMSEFGVGAVFGHKNFEELRWSENYQAEFYDHTINLFLNDEDICGVLLWQFCDIRSNAKWSLLRARSFNNKGLVNEYRHPKLAYYKVREVFGRVGN